MSQNKIHISGVIVGLMLALSLVYLVETIEEFAEDDILKGIFFLGVTVAYVVLAIILSSKKIYLYITGIGSAFLFILYFATRESMDDIGELGLTSKMIQLALLVFVIGILKKY